MMMGSFSKIDHYIVAIDIGDDLPYCLDPDMGFDDFKDELMVLVSKNLAIPTTATSNNKGSTFLRQLSDYLTSQLITYGRLNHISELLLVDIIISPPNLIGVKFKEYGD